MPKGEVDRDEICYLSRKKNWKLSDNVLKKRLSDMALDLSNGRRDFWWTPPGPNARRMVEEERKREEEKKMNGGKEVEEEMPPWMRKKTRKSSKSKVSAVPVSTKRAIHVQQ